MRRAASCCQPLQVISVPRGARTGRGPLLPVVFVFPWLAIDPAGCCVIASAPYAQNCYQRKLLHKLPSHDNMREATATERQEQVGRQKTREATRALRLCILELSLCMIYF